MSHTRAVTFVPVGRAVTSAYSSKKLQDANLCRRQLHCDGSRFGTGRRIQVRMTLTGSKVSSPWEALYEKYTKPIYTGEWTEDLLIAVKFDDFDKFLSILDTTGPDAVNTTWGGRRFNQSVLLAAASRGRTSMVRTLIARGADCTHRNDLGWGAVRYTRNYYDVLKMPEGPSLIQLLIQKGARNESRVGEPLSS